MAERNAIAVLIKLLGGEAMTAELEPEAECRFRPNSSLPSGQFLGQVATH